MSSVPFIDVVIVRCSYEQVCLAVIILLVHTKWQPIELNTEVPESERNEGWLQNETPMLNVQLYSRNKGLMKLLGSKSGVRGSVRVLHS